MKNFNNKKSIAERGGLMIEALAMLGLIAVVTPTMYKKSAERTMEVEDINTATTIRTIMGAAEAYMASNYTDIMRVMEENSNGEQHTINGQTIGVLDVPESELLPYLPYKYTANNALYNYRAPIVRIVRSGDNLTAFALFPAKVEDGIGQERTVRIASLVGSNGGYVSKENDKITAHGVGGIWNLDETQYENVFQNKDSSTALDANNYSIMVSSADVVNSSTGAGGGGDHPEFLLRYQKEGEEWRNAMRTDLYMGQGPAKDNDGSMVHNDLSSIRNINSLIVGTTNDVTETEQSLHGFGVSDNVADRELDSDNYGLYIIGSGTQGEGEGNAYITGTLLAAGNKLWASSEDLHYTGTNLTFDGTNFQLGKNDADNYMVEGYAEKDKSTLNIMNKKIMIAEDPDDAKITTDLGSDFSKQLNPDIYIAAKKDSDNDVEAPNYSEGNVPDFGVDVNGDMVVEGLLAAGQLDVNKIRTSSISVGSEHIDDEYKWMDVNDTGVHVHQPGDDGYKGTQLEAQDGKIAMRVGADNPITVGDDGSVNEEGTLNSNAVAQIVMDSSNGIMAKTNGAKMLLENSEVGIEMPSGESVVNIGNIDSDEVDLGTDVAHEVNIGYGGNMNVLSGNLHVTGMVGSEGNDASEEPLFSVIGNKGSESGVSDDTSYGSNDTQYEIIGHGDTVFTDRQDDARYLAMGVGPDTSAAVNIIRGEGTDTSDKSTELLVVDMEPQNYNAYAKEKVTGTSDEGHVEGSGVIYRIDNDATGGSDAARTIAPGAIYIRKGLLDIVPDSSYVGNGLNSDGSEYSQQAYTADNGRGVIRASRFVANNVDVSGDPIKVPDFYSKARVLDGQNTTTYDAFNGDNKERYDTYMVNPAYTSVMNDIKLVSRGGARLSDILPTFITKGIYTAVNGAPEQAYRSNDRNGGLNLKANGQVYLKSGNCPDGASACLNIARDYSNDGNLGNHAPASPIIGSIPSPQCPPGYMKVIQITPATIRMAEAGRFRNIQDGTDQTFDGLKINVDDFANPSNDTSVSMANMGDEYTTKKIYNLYKKADASDNNQMVNTESFQIESKDTLDFEFRNRGDCIRKDNNDQCLEYEWKVDPNYAESEDHDMMTIDLATVKAGNNPTSDNTLVNGESFMSQVNELQRTYTEGIGAESSNGIWKRTQDGSVFTNNDANIVNHTLKFKNAPLHYATTGENNEAVAADHLSYTDSNLHDVLLGVEHTVHDQIDLSGTRLVVDSIRNAHVADHKGQNMYVLTMRKGGMEPLTFQKSTWLKTDAIKLHWRNNYNYENDHPYTAGWAILMGFIYPTSAYQQVLESLDFGQTYHKLTSSKYNEVQNLANPTLSGETETFYWNIFPVERYSLEAYISTYCYFEETDYSERYNIDTGEFPMVDRINTYSKNYEPEGENKIYRQKLNDPSMKYNELW